MEVSGGMVVIKVVVSVILISSVWVLVMISAGKVVEMVDTTYRKIKLSAPLFKKKQDIICTVVAG